MNVKVEYPVKTAGRFELADGTLIKVPKHVLERHAALAYSDDKRRGDGVVYVPVCWLVGERIGY